MLRKAHSKIRLGILPSEIEVGRFRGVSLNMSELSKNHMKNYDPQIRGGHLESMQVTYVSFNRLDF